MINRYLPLFIALFFCHVAFTQAAVTEAAATLDTNKQKFSYIAGFQIAQSLKRDGTDLDIEAFSQAIQDVFTQTTLKMNREEMMAFLQVRKERMAREKEASAEKNRQAEKTFLDANRQQEGVVELPNGIQYQELKAGDGAQPKSSDEVTVHYRGTLLDGAVFDSSYQRGKPVSFRLDQVIKGWQETLPLMKTGAKWRAVIPASLAYGSRGMGGVIGPDATLIFEIELLKIN
ncbi:MAG: FKBP-type peptidyl-prolyl cis-trans isomerase [Gammaproteobacteria bacterium]|nr:FKBP-type peptidyl-prolyl cis-trans isomerase [Gammaproteobacteria bacterium]